MRAAPADAIAAGLFGVSPTSILIGVAGGIVISWLALVAVLWCLRGRCDLGMVRCGARILPDLLRLLKRLAADNSLPRGVRARLWLLLVFVLSPIDLIPDFIPVIGYLDDAVLIALVLRSVVRRSGRQAIERHWPGDPEGLAAVLRIAGIRDQSRDGDGDRNVPGTAGEPTEEAALAESADQATSRRQAEHRHQRDEPTPSPGHSQ